MSGPSQIRAHRFRLVTLVLLSLIAFAAPATASPAWDAAAVTDLGGPPAPSGGMHRVAPTLHNHALTNGSFTAVGCDEANEKLSEKAERDTVEAQTPATVPLSVLLAPAPHANGVLVMLSRLRAFPGRGPPHA